MLHVTFLILTLLRALEVCIDLRHVNRIRYYYYYYLPHHFAHLFLPSSTALRRYNANDDLMIFQFIIFLHHDHDSC